MIAFTVRGLPVSQGSARAFVVKGKAVIATDANRQSSPLGAWRTAIAQEARDAMGGIALLEGPVLVDVCFVLPRPRSHYLPATKSRPVPELRLDAPAWVSRTPDLDKATRALFDALTLVVWRDDAQVAVLMARKRYESATFSVGAVVRVSKLSITA